jgi:hypothetical protein
MAMAKEWDDEAVRCQLNKFLTSLGACKEVVEWAKDYASLEEAWNACERADWMMWLLAKMAGKKGWPIKREIVSLACDFAQDALPVFEQTYSESCVRDCISVLRKWIANKASTEKLLAAKNKILSANAFKFENLIAVPAARYATYAVLKAADAALYVVYFASDSAVHAAAAWQSDEDAKLKEYADLIRRKVRIP